MYWLRFFSVGPGFPVGLTCVLYIGATLSFRRAARLAAIVPFAAAGWWAYLTVSAYLRGGGTWPIGVMFFGASPPFVLLVLWSLGLACQQHGWFRVTALLPPSITIYYLGLAALVNPALLSQLVSFKFNPLPLLVGTAIAWAAVQAAFLVFTTKRRLRPT